MPRPITINSGLFNDTASDNSFFGQQAGQNTTTGGGNVIIGSNAGGANTIGSNNTIVGRNANVAANNLTFASAFGAGAVVSTSNTVVLGRNTDAVNVPGNLNITGTLTANLPSGDASYIQNRTTTQTGITNFNISGNGTIGGTLDATNVNGNVLTGIITDSTVYRIGGATVLSTAGTRNIFAGVNSGLVGTDNSFFGYNAGNANLAAGIDNSFFGSDAGGVNSSGFGNSFFGSDSGDSNTGGDNNSFFGRSAGTGNTSGNNNSFFGLNAGSSNTIGDNNTIIGAGADVGSNNLNFATAIGAGATVLNNNQVTIGRSADRVFIPGTFLVQSTVTLNSPGAGLGTPLCIGATFGGIVGICSSSLRYKTNVQTFTGGLNVVRRLRPITFNWKRDGVSDVGFGAEEVERVEPLLVTRRGSEIEGVKYAQITTVLVNAVNEQQAQIETQATAIERQAAQITEQQKQIDALKKLVCATNPDASICKEEK